ncbi:MAG: RIP metalloprotease RseP [Desulfarculales bacterium]|jgi:regulator of sigma E protease|nr:RIP metalloprotease RseP [Desulfarculales bacterium]
MLTVVSALAVLGVLIFVHELGHFLVAKLCGVGVEVFSLGFGPKIAGFTRGRTNYRLSAIPLGGYVRMTGEDPRSEPNPQDIPLSFTHKPVSRRLAIVAAGPLFNVFFALAVFYALIICAGLPQMSTMVGNVLPDSPAAAAGLRENDVITSLDGRPVAQWEEMVEMVQAGQGRTLQLEVNREGGNIALSLTPRLTESKNVFGEPVQVYQIGIQGSPLGLSVTYIPWQEAFAPAWDKTWEAGKLIFISIVKLIDGSLSLDTMGGPIKIAQISGQAAEHGLDSLAYLAAILSVNLAIINLLPIPALDGGHLLFFSMEAVSRRKPSLRVQERAQQVGIFLLITLMVVVLYNDIMSLIQ